MFQIYSGGASIDYTFWTLQYTLVMPIAPGVCTEVTCISDICLNSQDPFPSPDSLGKGVGEVDLGCQSAVWRLHRGCLHFLRQTDLGQS